MSISRFEALQLHDALLRSVQLDYASGTLTVAVQPVGAPEFNLVFTGVTKVQALREQPWGPSTSINTLRQPSISQFEIELQSGDVVAIEGTEFNTSRELLS